MKTTKQTANRRAKLRASRPLHKRILLHPFSVMVLLCAGVLIIGSTIVGYAASYTVTGTVPASLPTAPAVIAHPLALQHVSTPTVNVNGTCPAGAYAKLYVNSSFSGASQCTNNSFQIQTSLQSGANDLQAKVYNQTNNEGPQSSPVTVYYDATTVTPPATPAATPTADDPITINSVESGSYRKGTIEEVSSRPTISGYAPPFAIVTVTYHSEVKTCKTVADAQGWWQCTLVDALEAGTHHVDISMVTQGGRDWSFPTFQVYVRSVGVPPLLKPQPAPVFITTNYTYQTHYSGEPFNWTVGLTGGKVPYAVNVNWGDTSETNVSRSDGSTFTITHAFPSAKNYTVFLKATDGAGATTLVQLSAVVKGVGEPIASVTKPGPFNGFFTGFKRYLWIVWPVYVAVVLMAFSYWLGEQDMYQRVFRRPRLAPAAARTGKNQGRGRKF